MLLTLIIVYVNLMQIFSNTTHYIICLTDVACSFTKRAIDFLIYKYVK